MQDFQFDQHARIHQNTIVGNNVLVGTYSEVGAKPFKWIRGDKSELYRYSTGRFSDNCGVILEDDVELGSFVCVEYGIDQPTKIGKGTKIDNCVLIGEDAQIGEDTLIAGHTTVCGSVSIGDRCLIGVGVTIKPKIKIGNNVLVGAGSVVIEDIPDNSVVAGVPARILRENTFH